MSSPASSISRVQFQRLMLFFFTLNFECLKHYLWHSYGLSGALKLHGSRSPWHCREQETRSNQMNVSPANVRGGTKVWEKRPRLPTHTPTRDSSLTSAHPLQEEKSCLAASITK